MKTIGPPVNPLLLPAAAVAKAKTKSAIRFYRPIHVLVIDAKGAYCRTVWCAVGLGLANIFIGAVNMVALMYTLSKGDAHVFLCTIAYHFFSAEAILSLNYANGWSTPMRLRHRKFAHVLLQVCGIACAAAGTALVIVEKGVAATPHAITGLITAGVGVAAAILGPFVFRRKKRTLKIIHMSFGMVGFLVSSVCLCLGCLTGAFSSWASTNVVALVVAFTLFFNMFILGTVFLKCVSQI